MIPEVFQNCTKFGLKNQNKKKTRLVMYVGETVKLECFDTCMYICTLCPDER